MRCAVFPRALPQPDGFPQSSKGLCPGQTAHPISLGNCIPQAMPNPLQPIQKGTILQPLAAALMPFQIGSFPISDHNKRPRPFDLGLALSVRHIGIYQSFFFALFITIAAASVTIQIVTASLIILTAGMSVPHFTLSPLTSITLIM